MDFAVTEKGEAKMARYIDAEHLIQLINDNKELSKWGKGVAIACVMDTPVVDMREIACKAEKEVIQCKDCEHFGVDDNNEPFCTLDEGMTYPVEFGFCSYGKKRKRG